MYTRSETKLVTELDQTSRKHFCLHILFVFNCTIPKCDQSQLFRGEVVW